MFMLLYLGFFVIFLMRIVRKKDDRGKFDKSLMIVKKLKINFQPVDSPSHSHKTFCYLMQTKNLICFLRMTMSTMWTSVTMIQRQVKKNTYVINCLPLFLLFFYHLYASEDFRMSPDAVNMNAAETCRMFDLHYCTYFFYDLNE